MFWSQNVRKDDNILLRFTDNTLGPGNPSTPIDVNMFRTTNFWSRSAMRGAEFHGNTRRDSTTRILSIRPYKTYVGTLTVRQLYVEAFVLLVSRRLGLVTNYGEGGVYKTGRGGGVREVLPLRKGGAEKVLAMLKGEHKKFWGSLKF